MEQDRVRTYTFGHWPRTLSRASRSDVAARSLGPGNLESGWNQIRRIAVKPKRKKRKVMLLMVEWTITVTEESPNAKAEAMSPIFMRI